MMTMKKVGGWCAIAFALTGLTLGCSAETTEPPEEPGEPAPTVETSTIAPAALARCPFSRKIGECPGQEACATVKTSSGYCKACVCLGGN